MGLTDRQKLILTGGVSIATCLPVAAVYEFNVLQMGQGARSKIKNMHQKRYGHQSAFIRDKLLVFGGFAHPDLPEEPPSTLATCELLPMSEGQWETISPMNTARAFASACAISEQYCYLFGGLSDYQILNSIEKYDIITDTWISLYFKLPMPLAKLASVSLVDQKGILILGGMSADFEPTNQVWRLDLMMATFTRKAPMRYDRLIEGGQGAFRASNGNVFVLNGCLDDLECERYKPSRDVWELVPSYRAATDNESLNAYIGAIVIHRR